MKDNVVNIIKKIKEQKAQKFQNKNNKLMVLDAEKLLQKEEIAVNFFTPNNEYEERNIKDHNLHTAFHNYIWEILEPHEKIAFLMKLDQKLVSEQNDNFTPKNTAKFVVGSFYDSYFAKRENHVNTYYIGLEMLQDESVDSYAMLYMLFSLQMQAKAYEQLEQKTVNDKVLDQLILNIKHPINRTASYDKFIMQEPMTSDEEVEASLFLCQPIEEYSKLNTQKVEEIAYKINNFGIGIKDDVFEIFLDDRAYFDQKQAELIEKVHGKGVTASDVYYNAINSKEKGLDL
jgi:hypothetical protein